MLALVSTGRQKVTVLESGADGRDIFGVEYWHHPIDVRGGGLKGGCDVQHEVCQIAERNSRKLTTG